MGLLVILQVIFDLAFIATATLLLIERSKSRTSEDPRLSRGLQLLSSKIAIIEDLMDRSESMSRQMTTLIDGKRQDLQERLEDAEVHLHKIKQATEKSEKIARIFQDKIPHEEILQKQNSEKYHFAAKLSHQGLSFDEIARQVDIPRGELDLIMKVNRNRVITEKIELKPVEREPVEFIQKTSVQEAFRAIEEEPAPIVTPAPAPAELAVVANNGNRESTIRPFVFRRISNKITINEMDLQK